MQMAKNETYHHIFEEIGTFYFHKKNGCKFKLSYRFFDFCVQRTKILGSKNCDFCIKSIGALYVRTYISRLLRTFPTKPVNSKTRWYPGIIYDNRYAAQFSLNYCYQDRHT